MSPHRLASRHVVTGDDLVVTALLLRVEQAVADGGTTTTPASLSGAIVR